MSNLTTRAGKGSPLTNNELDANFTNLNADKVEIGGDLSGTSSAPNVAKIQGRAVSADAPAIGEKLVWNGTAWEPSADPTNEPIGHEDKSSSSISFNSGTRTFTISPVAANFVVWCKGVKYTYTSAQTVVIPDTTGLHFIYFNASGVLSTQMSYFTWEEHAPTAYVYWNATTQQAVYFGDERHGITLDWQTHEYLHRTRGAAIASGFGASGYTTTGSGSTDADAQIDIGGGTFFDEDLQVDIVSTNTPVAGSWQQDLSGPARIPVLYLSGSAWVIDAPTDFPFKVVSGVPQYNLYSGGTWSSAPVANNGYFVSWILATHNLTYPVIAVISQAATNQVSEAEAMTFEGLTLSGFPSVEFRPLYKVIYQHKTSFANNIKASTIAVYDLRSISAAGVAAALVQDHGNLSGLGDDDHAQYLHVSAVRSPSAAVTNSFLPSQASQSGKYLTTDGSNPSWGSIPSGSLTFTGDVTGSGTTGSSTTLTLANSGASAGTYTKVTVDAKGRVTTGASINSSDVTTALGFTPENSGNKGVANGYASLDGSGKVPSVQLPSYVDDVLEYANLAAFPGTGETGKIYIAIDTAKTYRWSGSAYVEISASPGSTDAVPEGSTNLYFTNSRARGAITATGSLSYNNQTGVLSYTQPTNVSTFTNDSGYLTGITGTQVANALGYTPPQPNGTGASGTWNISIAGNAATVSSITSGQVTTALGYTPYNSSNPSGYITSSSLSSYLPLSGGTVSGGTTFSSTVYFGTDIQLTRSDVSPALLFTNQNQWRWIYNGGGNYWQTNLSIVSGGNNIAINGNAALHAANYSSYALPLSGGTLTGVTLVKRNLGTNDYTNVGQHNLHLRLQRSSDLKTLELGVLDNGTGVIQANEAGVGYNTLALNPVSGTVTVNGNQVLHAGNYTSYSPSLTGSGASGTWGISITGNTSGATLPQYYGSAFNWNGVAVQHYWTRIANVSGNDGWAMVLVTTKQDVNYVPSGAYLLSISRFNGSSFSVKVDALNSHDTNLLVRIDNNGGVWIKANVEWNSQKAWRVIASLGENVMYGSFNSETLSTPADSIELSPGQQVRGTQGAATSASVSTNTNRLGAITALGSITTTSNGNQLQFQRSDGTTPNWTFHGWGGGLNIFSSAVSTLYIGRDGPGTNLDVYNGALTQGGNQVLHAGNYTSYSPSLTGTGASGTWAINVTGSSASTTGNAATASRVVYGGNRTAETGSAVSTPSDRIDFVGAYANGYPATYGNVMTIRGGGVSQLYLGWNGGSVAATGELYYRSMTDWMDGWGSWRRVLNDSNYSSYALPLSGGTLTGTLTVGTDGGGANFVQRTVNGWQDVLTVWRGGSNVWSLQDSSGSAKVTSGSFYIGSNLALHAGNYSSYALPLSGGTTTGSIFAQRSRLGFSSNDANHSIYNNYSNIDGEGGWDGMKMNVYLGLQIRTGNASGAVPTTVLDISASAVNSTVALRQGGNQVLHAGNYSSYALPLIGGNVTVAADTATSFTNSDLGGSHYTNRGNRYLTSNGSNWLADGQDVPLVISGSYSTTTRGRLGLALHNESSTDGAFSPAIVFGSRSNSGSYNSGYAFIMGKKTGANSGVDTNWNSGELHFYAVGSGYIADTPNFTVTNGSSLVNGNTILHAGNYTSYSPSLTGGGASGTWGINITGNSGSASSVAWGNVTSRPSWLTSASLVASHANANEFRNSGFYENDGGGSNWPSGTWYNSINVRHSNQGNYHGFQIAMSYYDNNLWFRSYQGQGTFQSWAVALSSQNYNSYSPTLTGGGASGTWGISITGNAATVGSRGVGNSYGNIAYFDGSGNLFVNNPESYSGEVRLGAAWGRGGVYGSNGVTVSTSGSFIDHVHGNNVSMRHVYDSNGSRVIIGTNQTSTPYTLVDTNARPTLYMRGQYPVLVLDHTATGNTNHGPTIQFVHDGAGARQWLIGTNGSGTNIDFGYADSGTGNSNYNPHNGIAGYLGNTWMTVRNNGRMGFGWEADWGAYGANSEPLYTFHFIGSHQNSHTYLFRNTTSASNGSGAIFVNTHGNHSWGICTEFRVDGSSGGDRPSILFSSGYNSDTWSVGFGSGSDSNFRINRDHGHRNGSWGTTLMVMDRSGNVTFSGNVTAYSDRRLKTDIKRIENAGDIVRRLEGVSFKYREDGRDGIGLIAQDVELVLPQIVGEATSSDGSTHKNVAYGNVVAVLIEAIKELQLEVAALKSTLH